MTGNAAEDGARRPLVPVLAASILGSSVVFIDGTAVTVALPVLQRDLGADVVTVQWVVEAFAVMLASLLLLGGALGDRLGRRRVFTVGTIGFAAASAWCGLAPDSAQLVGARALQGVFGALLVPVSLALINAHVPAARRGRAIGTWAAFSALSVVLGPVLGGWLVDQASWRWIFFINLPLAAGVLVVLAVGVPESRDPTQRGGFDWLGAGLATGGLSALVFGLLEAGRIGFGELPVLGGIIGGGALLAGFLRVEARARAPMMPLALFRSRGFAGANTITLLLYAALGAGFFFLPLNMIQVQDMGALETGTALLPLIVVIAILSRLAGRVTDRIGARLPLILGSAVTGLGYALLIIPDADATYWTGFLPGLIVLGLGMGLAVAPLTTVVMAAVPVSSSGVAAGINNTASRLGGLLAIACLGLVMLAVFNTALDGALAEISLPADAQAALEAERINLAAARVPNGLDPDAEARLKQAIEDAFVSGFRVVCGVCAALSLLSSFVAAGTISRQSTRP